MRGLLFALYFSEHQSMLIESLNYSIIIEKNYIGEVFVPPFPPHQGEYFIISQFLTTGLPQSFYRSQF